MARIKRKRVNKNKRNVKPRSDQSINTQRELKARKEETVESSHVEMHDDSESNSQVQNENRDCPHCGMFLKSVNFNLSIPDI